MRNSCYTPGSLLWCDFVKRCVVDGTSNQPGIAKFLDGMEELGERFIFGCDAPVDFLQDCGFDDAAITPADVYLDRPDPTFATYQFVVAEN